MSSALPPCCVPVKERGDGVWPCPSCCPCARHDIGACQSMSESLHCWSWSSSDPLVVASLAVLLQVAVLPSTVTCGCLLNACEFAGAWQTAFLLLEEMISASILGVRKLCFNGIVTGLKLPECWMLRLQLNIVICNTLISTCEKACQWQSALALLFNTGQFQAVELSVWTCPCMNSLLAGAAGCDRNERILGCMRLCGCLVLGMH